MLIPTSGTFRATWDNERAQWVVQCGGVVIVATRAHRACCVCGMFREEHGLSAHKHAFTPDDARERAPKLADVLNRIYGARRMRVEIIDRASAIQRERERIPSCAQLR